jgi:hypothetical protein
VAGRLDEEVHERRVIGVRTDDGDAPVNEFLVTPKDDAGVHEAESAWGFPHVDEDEEVTVAANGQRRFVEARDLVEPFVRECFVMELDHGVPDMVAFDGHPRKSRRRSANE